MKHFNINIRRVKLVIQNQANIFLLKYFINYTAYIVLYCIFIVYIKNTHYNNISAAIKDSFIIFPHKYFLHLKWALLVMKGEGCKTSTPPIIARCTLQIYVFSVLYSLLATTIAFYGD